MRHEDLDVDQALSTPLKVLSFISIALAIVGLTLGFLDTLTTIDYGILKSTRLLIFLIVGIFSSIILFLVHNAQLEYDDEVLSKETLLGIVLVSLLFAGSVAGLAYTSFQLAHQHLATVKPVTFTLTKQDILGFEYDEWNSALGNIDCQPSDVKDGSTFDLNVNYFMGVKKFDMADICLEDERNEEESADTSH